MISLTVQADNLDSVTSQFAVRFSELSITTPEGAETLYARIRLAAKLVCGTEGERKLALLASRRDCVQKAIDTAITDVNSAELTEIYQAHQGRGKAPRVASADDQLRTER